MSRVNYRYFRDPHHFSFYTREPQPCEICEAVRAGYSGSFYGLADVDFVCEECLSGGALQERQMSTNEGDIEALRNQLTTNSDLNTDQIDVAVKERTEELQHRTPSILTWQDFEWPAHCGDYCCFVKEVGKPDLIALSADGDGKAFLAENLHDEDSDADSIWEDIRPDSPRDNSVAYSMGVYLFDCLHCGRHLIKWDCN